MPTLKNDDGHLLMELGGRQRRASPMKGAIPKLDPFELADLAQGMLRFNRLNKQVDPAIP